MTRETRNRRKHRERAGRRAIARAAAEEAAALAAHRERERLALVERQRAAAEVERQRWIDTAHERRIAEIVAARGGAYCGHGKHRTRGEHGAHGVKRKKRGFTPLQAVLLMAAAMGAWS